MDFQVGENVTVINYKDKCLDAKYHKKKRGVKKLGKITGVFRDYVNVHTGRYVESFMRVDITLGHVKVERTGSS